MSTTERSPETEGGLAQPAGFVSRAMAFTVDLLVISIGMAGATVVFDSLGIVFTTVDLNSLDHTGYLAVGFLVFMVYCALGFTLFGQTIGKLLFGLRVVRPDGSNPHLARSLIRAFTYSLSAVLGIGFLIVLVTRDRRALQDYLAGTFVVYAWPARPRTLVDLRSLEPLVPDTHRRPMRRSG